MNRNIGHLQNISDIASTGQAQRIVRSGGDLSFHDVLKAQLDERSSLTFSSHAAERLRSRNIDLQQADLNRINGAVERAREKGAENLLVLLDDNALIVSVKNGTVITAMNGDDMRENVFTQIDSTVIA